jgi:hypothetical protein
MINIADIVNPLTGLTYRQENAKLVHEIPIGTFVKSVHNGICGWIASHDRDCDKTPLYGLTLNESSVGMIKKEKPIPYSDVDHVRWLFYDMQYQFSISRGHSFESLQVLREPTQAEMDQFDLTQAVR